jgi:uncharacterized protein YutE (UPF0331/DUF86 family)
MVNEDIVLRLLNNIEGYVTELRRADDITHSKFIGDIRSQRFVERTLQIAVEACMDVAHHVISDEQWREPANYADAFMVLAENGVLRTEDAQRYRLMAQFRNKIVHYYEKVDPEQVFAILTNHLNDFTDYVAAVRAWIRCQGS